MILTIALILLYILYQFENYKNMMAFLAIMNKTTFKDNNFIIRLALAMTIAILFGIMFTK